MLNRLRRILRPLLLHGPLRRWWSLRQSRRLEAAYLRTLSRERERPMPPDIFLSAAPARPVLRQILFIGDCLWEENQLFPELRQLADLHHLNLRRSLAARSDADLAGTTARSIEQFIAQARRIEPDAILFYARPALLSSAAFDLLRRRWSCPLLGLNLDDRVEFFDYQVLNASAPAYGNWVAKFDLNLTSTRVALDWYRQRGAAVRYLPPGFHCPSQYQQAPSEADYDYRVSFVGSAKPERRALVQKLTAAGIEPTLFGKGWTAARWIENPTTVFRRTQLNLGFGFALPSAGITTIKGRDFECPGVGACYLTTYNWELTDFYDVGREILCYRGFEELLEMYAWYTKRPVECWRIAQAAHRRAAAEHTWEKRFRAVFEELGFRLPPSDNHHP